MSTNLQIAFWACLIISQVWAANDKAPRWRSGIHLLLAAVMLGVAYSR